MRFHWTRARARTRARPLRLVALDWCCSHFYHLDYSHFFFKNSSDLKALDFSLKNDPWTDITMFKVYMDLL